MTEQDEPKKKTLAEAAKEMLKKKKEAQKGTNHHPKYTNDGKPMMKSQHTQKPNNTRKKMGV